VIVTFPQLPPSPAAWAGAGWSDIEPFYTALLSAPLTEQSLDPWLAQWSALESLLTEAASRAMIAHTLDTGNAGKEAAHLRFSTEVLPRAEEQSVKVARRLLASGFSRPDLETTLRRFRTDSELFREENVPLQARIEELATGYRRITGGMLADWEGERLPLPRLQPFLKERDRAVRERAFRALADPYIERRSDLATIFDQMYELRQRVAHNAGFANFRDFIFPAKYRFDYTPSDCERLHEAIERTVVPAVERALDARRERLGLDRLRPWDTQVAPWRDKAIHPFANGEQLAQRARLAFEEVDPGLGRHFQRLMDEQLLDLESRKGKAPGGYCDTLHFSGQPFIFMNASGIEEDVTTLLHEAGHAFHALEAHHLPYIWQRHPGSESAELASMSMELLAAPFLATPAGFYDELGAESAELEHLEDVLITLAHVASVDAFQTWIYTSGEGNDATARDRAWLAIRERFERGVDWSGLEAARVARWYRQLHIFLYPFYYIEYGIAQIGALQVWRNALADRESAVRNYRAGLALGATRPLPELYRAAGVRLTFDPGDLASLVAGVEERMEELRESLRAAA
jgi:oligoendopeptidase F